MSALRLDIKITSPPPPAASPQFTSPVYIYSTHNNSLHQQTAGAGPRGAPFPLIKLTGPPYSKASRLWRSRCAPLSPLIKRAPPPLSTNPGSAPGRNATHQKGTKSKRDPGGQAVTAQEEPQEEATGAGGGGGGIRAGQRCRPTRASFKRLLRRF